MKINSRLDIRFQQFSALPDQQQWDLAGIIANYTDTDPNLLKVEGFEVVSSLGLVATLGDGMVGYIRASGPNELGQREVGTLISWLEGRGIGGQLVAGITSLVIDGGHVPIGFANSVTKDGKSGSYNLFIRAGYEDARLGEIAQGALDACKGCDFYEMARSLGKLCHDTPVIYRGGLS